MPDEAGGGGFAIAAGDGEDAVALVAQQVGKDGNIACYHAAALFKFADFRLPAADARAEDKRGSVCQRGFQAA